MKQGEFVFSAGGWQRCEPWGLVGGQTMLSAAHPASNSWVGTGEELALVQALGWDQSMPASDNGPQQAASPPQPARSSRVLGAPRQRVRVERGLGPEWPAHLPWRPAAPARSRRRPAVPGSQSWGARRACSGKQGQHTSWGHYLPSIRLLRKQANIKHNWHISTEASRAERVASLS